MSLIELRTKLEACNNLESILRSNEYARTVATEDVKKHQGYEYLSYYFGLIKKGEFSWEIFEDDTFTSIRELTQLRNFTLKNSKKELVSLMGGIDIFRDIFPLDMVAAFVSKPYYLFGTPIYDKTLRV